MTLTPKRKHSLSWLGALPLTILAVLFNYFSVEIFFGIDFLFGSVFVFIIVFTYGLRAGLAASLIASTATFFLWGHVFGIILLTCEAAAVYWLQRRSGMNPAILVAVYWLFAGIPLVYLTYFGFLGTDLLDTTIVGLKYMVNGILNSLIFSIFHLLYQQYVLKRFKPKRFQEVLFITFTSIFLIPSMFMLVYEGNKEYKEELVRLEQTASLKKQMISSSLSSWESAHRASLNTLKLYISEDSRHMQQHLQELGRSLPYVQDIYVFNHRKDLDYIYSEKSNLPFYHIPFLKLTKMNPYVTDVYLNQFTREQMTSIVVPFHEEKYTGFAVATYRIQDLLMMLNRMEPRENIEVSLYDEQLLSMYRLSQLKNGKISEFADPNSSFIMQPGGDQSENKMNRWKESSLAERTAVPLIPWNLFTAVEIEPYQDRLYMSYIKLFGMILMMIGMSIFLAYWLSNILVNSIRSLSIITEQVSPAKMAGQKIAWPKTSIMEVSRLTKSFEQLISDFNQIMQELKSKQKKLEYFAHYDVLTNMHNRYSFTEQLERELRLSGQFDRSLALMFCDLDRFKLINDSLGHDTGDELLRELSNKIRNICGECAILCRHGGDEFLIALPAEGEDSAAAAARKLLEDISKPIVIGEHEVSVTCSIGISLYPAHATTIEGLISTADIAMYSAKEKGKNTFEFFSPELSGNLARRVMIENELQKGIEFEEFHLHYQPQLDLKTNRMTGLEALIRWENPRLGRVSPAEFIPVAEETGIIRRLGEWVIDRAASDMRKLMEHGHHELSVAVNISIKQFYHDSLPGFIMEVLAKHQVPASRFKIEITESVVIGHFDLVLEQLHSLKKEGIQIALDDFGTGYSSLNYLKILPIDIVKIDRSFIQDILSNPEDAAIVQAVIQIAESSSLTVIAEGVETDEQTDFLRVIGCHQGQGYTFSRPKPIEALLTELEEQYTKG